MSLNNVQEKDHSTRILQIQPPALKKIPFAGKQAKGRIIQNRISYVQPITRGLEQAVPVQQSGRSPGL